MTSSHSEVYPRDSWGFCNQMSEGAGAGDAGTCEYPYERNKQSSAYIPDHVGKFVHKGKNKWSNGKNQRFCVTTGWYLQRSFWGGRAAVVLAAAAEVAGNIASDRLSGMPATAIKSELYWNQWVYKHSVDKKHNFRILGHSYNYPNNTKGFGDWIAQKATGIIVRDQDFGWQSNPEIEIASVPGQCLDTFLKPFVGLYGCHHGGKTQAWHFENGVVSTAHESVQRCLDATGVHVDEPVNLAGCATDDGEEGGPPKKSQTWDFVAETGQLKSKSTGLCMDVVTKPPHDKRPAVLSVCKSGAKFQKFTLTPLSMLTCTQKWCRKQ